MNLIKESNVRGSTQRALWGAVTGNLRAVTATIIDNEIMLYFYYDKEPTENEIELSQIASTEVVSDFLVMIGEEQILLPQPEPIPLKDGELVYHRYEEQFENKIKKLFKDINIYTVYEASRTVLIGHVTTNLRAASVSFIDNFINLYFYYDKSPSNEEVRLSEVVMQNILSCFEEAKGGIERFVIPEPEKISLRNDGFWLYWRYEEYLIDD